ncbi:VWA domain-containing protein [soil metagenome]
MRFLWPDFLWLMSAVPLLVACYVVLLRRRTVAVRYASLILVRDALGSGQSIRRHVPPALALLGVAAALFAIARPSAQITLPTHSMTLALAMDVSRSMLANDVEPTRITAAQAAAKTFIEDLKPNVRVGIVSFAGTAVVVQSPTENKQEMLAAIDRFELQRGTATGSGLILALGMLLPQAGITLETPAVVPGMVPAAVGSFGSGAVILLSDGRRTTGRDPLEAARMAADRGVRVFTVGFGTPDGGGASVDSQPFYFRLDEETLQAVAKMTGGEYFHAGTAADLRKVYELLGTKFAMERQEVELSAILAGAAAALLGLAMLLSLIWSRR